MTTKPIEVRKTLRFGTQMHDMLGLGGGIAIFFFALFIQQTQRPDYKAWAFMAFGIAIAIWALVRIIRAKDGLVLSQRGIFLRVPGISSAFIPWSEVSAVDTLDINVERGTFKDVTVVTIGKAYYDQRIRTNAIARRVVPDWDYTFSVLDNNHVQVAVHHSGISQPAQKIRAEVEARWRAFGAAKAENVQRAEA